MASSNHVGRGLALLGQQQSVEWLPRAWEMVTLLYFLQLVSQQRTEGTEAAELWVLCSGRTAVRDQEGKSTDLTISHSQMF